MGKKAVYSNKGLQVYITREHFGVLLGQKRLSVPVVIGKNPNAIGLVHVEVSSSTREALENAFQLEQAAVDEVREGQRIMIRNTAKRILKEDKE